MAGRNVRVGVGGAVIGLFAHGACLSRSRPASGDSPVVRLVDVFKPEMVENSAAAPAGSGRRTEWRFDSAPPAQVPKELAATRGWDSANVQEFAVRDQHLVSAAWTRSSRASSNGCAR